MDTEPNSLHASEDLLLGMGVKFYVRESKYRFQLPGESEYPVAYANEEEVVVAASGLLQTIVGEHPDLIEKLKKVLPLVQRMHVGAIAAMPLALMKRDKRDFLTTDAPKKPVIQPMSIKPIDPPDQAPQEKRKWF
jgi:hypothetical protein